MPFTKLGAGTTGWLLVILLVITFSLGALLTMTITERNRIKADLKEVKQELRDEKGESKLQKDNFNGCLGQLELVNKAVAEQSLASVESNKQSNLVVNDKLAQLPTLIRKDHASAAKPAAANAWLQELFR